MLYTISQDPTSMETQNESSHTSSQKEAHMHRTTRDCTQGLEHELLEKTNEPCHT